MQAINKYGYQLAFLTDYKKRRFSIQLFMCFFVYVCNVNYADIIEPISTILFLLERE